MRILKMGCFLLPLWIFACTDFALKAKDGTWVNGRSLEFAMDLQSKIRVFARNQHLISKAPQNKPGLEWTNKYGYVGVTGLSIDVLFDGMNEAGLSCGFLWLPGFTEYPPVDAADAQTLDFVDIGSWMLGSFASIAEVKQGLEKVKIWAHPVAPLGLAPIHIAVHDAQGNHLVVEFVEAQVKIYDNPLSVLTNSPPFPWQITNLARYLYLNPVNPTNVSMGQGYGMIGMPGDWTPPSRFVKIATSLRFALMPNDRAGAVNLAEHFLNMVDIPLGVVRDPGKETGDFTQWVVIKDLTHKDFYFRSYRDLTLKRIDLKALDFSKPLGQALSITTNASPRFLDVTKFYTNSTAQR